MATNHEVAGSNPAGQELHKSDTDRLPNLGVVFVSGAGEISRVATGGPGKISDVVANRVSGITIETHSRNKPLPPEKT